eukprot:m.488618 g.488618  ORF g.488618 m.488618 type:complete len:67 (+) comp88849_c0_seq1:31-231(+)
MNETRLSNNVVTQLLASNLSLGPRSIRDVRLAHTLAIVDTEAKRPELKSTLARSLALIEHPHVWTT